MILKIILEICERTLWNGKGRGYNVYIEALGRGSYRVADNAGYYDERNCRFEDAISAGRSMARKRGDGASLIVEYYKSAEKGYFMLIGKRFMKYRYAG